MTTILYIHEPDASKTYAYPSTEFEISAKVSRSWNETLGKFEYDAELRNASILFVDAKIYSNGVGRSTVAHDRCDGMFVDGCIAEFRRALENDKTLYGTIEDALIQEFEAELEDSRAEVMAR